MVCTYCSNETDVINSRPQKRQNSVWRRRRCKACGAVFTTSEQATLSDSLRVRMGAPTKAVLQPFRRDQLFLSIYKSCAHRKDAISDASSLTTTVINRLLSPKDNQPAIIDNKTIANVVAVVLKRFDNAAAVHYLAFHNK